MKRFIGGISLLIVLLIVFSCLDILQVQADEIEKFYSSSEHEREMAEAEKALDYVFDVDVDCVTHIGIAALKQCDIHMVMNDSSDNLIAEATFSKQDGKFDEDYHMYAYSFDMELKKGKGYKLQLTFTEENEFSMIIARVPIKKEMPAVTISKGIPTLLKADKMKVQKWKSSNPKIVSVENGKVVGNKTGNATITAVIKDSLKLTWNIKVEENVYKEARIKLSPKSPKKRYIQVDKAYYSGNKIILNVRIVNNTTKEYVQLQNLKIDVKTADGKKIGLYKEKKRDIKIPARKVKTLTVTIDKPSMQKADLRCAKISTQGALFYYK